MSAMRGARIMLLVGPTSPGAAGWQVADTHEISDRPGDPSVTVHDASGALSVTGHLSDLADWAVDLAATLTVLQVQHLEVSEPHTPRGEDHGQGDTDHR